MAVTQQENSKKTFIQAGNSSTDTTENKEMHVTAQEATLETQIINKRSFTVFVRVQEEARPEKHGTKMYRR